MTFPPVARVSSSGHAGHYLFHSLPIMYSSGPAGLAVEFHKPPHMADALAPLQRTITAAQDRLQKEPPAPKCNVGLKRESCSVY